MILAARPLSVAEVKGSRFVHSSYRITPNAHTSDLTAERKEELLRGDESKGNRKRREVEEEHQGG
jgi:hypothetical protein